MFNLIILSLFITLATCEPVWETIALSDCNGGMSLLPSSPVSFFKKIIPPYHISKNNIPNPKIPKPTTKTIQKRHSPLMQTKHPDVLTTIILTKCFFSIDKQLFYFFSIQQLFLFFLNRWPFTSMDLKAPT